MVYAIEVYWQLASRNRTELLLRPDPARKLSAHIPLLCVQWKSPDDEQRKRPKYVEFYSKNKFQKLVHLVGGYYKNLKLNKNAWIWKPLVHAAINRLNRLHHNRTGNAHTLKRWGEFLLTMAVVEKQ